MSIYKPMNGRSKIRFQRPGVTEWINGYLVGVNFEKIDPQNVILIVENKTGNLEKITAKNVFFFDWK